MDLWMEVLPTQPIHGHDGPGEYIDDATRYLTDPEYALEMDAELKRLQFTDEELESLDLNDPPPNL